MEEIKSYIETAKKIIEKEIESKHFIKCSEAMDTVERVRGQEFSNDYFYDELMNILSGATENLNSLTLWNGDGYYVGTREEDIKEFARLVDISDRDDVWYEFVEVDGISDRLFSFV